MSIGKETTLSAAEHPPPAQSWGIHFSCEDRLCFMSLWHQADALWNFNCSLRFEHQLPEMSLCP